MLVRVSRTKADEWARRVRRWKASGLSAKDFAEGEDFRAKTLSWWASELKRRERDGKPSWQKSKSPKLARVVRKAEAQAPSTGVVVRLGGAEVLVAPGTDRKLLGDVVEVLRGGAR